MNRRRTIQEFRAERATGQAALMEADHLGIKRFLRLDSATYEDGALDGRTKELLGLVASAVLRCNDCIDYHLEQCVALGYTKEQLVDKVLQHVNEVHDPTMTREQVEQSVNQNAQQAA